MDRRSRNHPLLRLWDEAGPEGFLQLNALAEDLRLVAPKLGWATVLADLTSVDRYESSRHTAHTAALFERHQPDRLVQFIESRNETVPDYLVKVGNITVPVEAKLAMTSVIQEAFNAFASAEVERCTQALAGRSQSYFVVVAIKDATKKLSPGTIAKAVAQMPTIVGQHRAEFVEFNIWGEVVAEYPNFTEHREVHLIAPIHEKDHLRLKGPAKKASKQLRTLPDISASGILALGLAQHEPEAVFQILDNEMAQGCYRGIGAALLIKRGTHLEHPRRSVVDLLEIRRNRWISNSINHRIDLKPIDLFAKLTEAEPSTLEKPAYRCAAVTGRLVSAEKGFALGLGRLDRIPKGLL